MKIINASIDISKINKSKIKKTDKNGQPFRNGQMFYNITIMVKDEVDQYDNNVSITDAQTKEEREAKEKPNYLGNGKVVYDGGNSNTSADLPF